MQIFWIACKLILFSQSYEKNFPWFIPYFLLSWADFVGQRKGRGKSMSRGSNEALGSSACGALWGIYKNVKKRGMSFLLGLYTSEILCSWWIGPYQTELRRIWIGWELAAFISWLQPSTHCEYQVDNWYLHYRRCFSKDSSTEQHCSPSLLVYFQVFRNTVWIIPVLSNTYIWNDGGFWGPVYRIRTK